jgi:hypothetical protein
MTSTQKIFKVEAHDTTDTDYPCTSPMFFIAENAQELRAQVESDNEGLIEIDEITEVPVEEVVRLLNLYIA